MERPVGSGIGTKARRWNSGTVAAMRGRIGSSRALGGLAQLCQVALLSPSVRESP
ncbi:hypothetical protein P0W64_09900 [Tsukamurella sp. 8F]|uniref:hypothetical protein n=1 Tax=unclassified Tsukamurella TaxID=2633480 RepID=UPI0023B9E795|nr:MULTISPECIES: hypothetical protein [unclassified Tsukamurella]MDF0529408.1 hypothetical protein [Tsukamurella sp. 8J]MDF0587085.1 hypothetical protein [Tsukamurella sp. 8F]